MNLSTDPWIPIVWRNGRAGTVSLTDAFVRGHDIQDLAVRPHERIALMRLFLCVAHAALGGPADHDDWATCLERLPAAASRYLMEWMAAFELFGDGPRFLQVGNLASTKAEGDEGISLSKLDLALATGNNPTLFDNAGGGERQFSPPELALMLLTFQAYSPGGMIGVALWSGRPTLGWKTYPRPAPGQSSHAPCLPGSMLHAYPRAECLSATLHLNLLAREDVATLPGIQDWGRPVWEQMPSSPTDKPAIANASKTYLGRLVPLSRAIRLQTGNGSMLLANGVDYPSWPETREPSASVITREFKGKSDRIVVSASLDRAPWRELSALTVKTVSAGTNGGPLALQNLSGDAPFDLWVGGLIADKAKVLDVVESVFHIPAAMLQTTGQRCYERGVKFAEDMAWRLGQAVSAYHRELGDSLDRAEARDRRDQLRANATFQFWTQAEHHVPLLLAAVANESPPAEDQWVETDWGQAIRQYSREAYELACPRQTARQMQAFVGGLAVLFSKRDNRTTSERP